MLAITFNTENNQTKILKFCRNVMSTHKNVSKKNFVLEELLQKKVSDEGTDGQKRTFWFVRSCPLTSLHLYNSSNKKFVLNLSRPFKTFLDLFEGKKNVSSFDTKSIIFFHQNEKILHSIIKNAEKKTHHKLKK